MLRTIISFLEFTQPCGATRVSAVRELRPGPLDEASSIRNGVPISAGCPKRKSRFYWSEKSSALPTTKPNISRAVNERTPGDDHRRADRRRDVLQELPAEGEVGHAELGMARPDLP